MSSSAPSAAIPAEIPRHEDLVNERLVAWYFIASLVFLGTSMLAGLHMALQLVHWNPCPDAELLSPGRWRMVHTNAVAYGFLANAFLGMLHWTVPRLTLRPVASSALSYFIFGAWQFVVLSTAAGILIGPSLQDAPWVMELAAKYNISMSLGAAGARLESVGRALRHCHGSRAHRETARRFSNRAFAVG